jgi:hypothetical protein
MACISPTKCQEIKDSVAGLKSRRMKILESLRQVLETITEKNGYCHDIDEASFNVNAWRDRLEGDTPVIYIVDDKANNIQRMAGKQRQISWKVILFGIVKGFDIFEFEQHIADVQECLEDNGFLCGEVSQIEVDAIRTDNQLFSEKEDTHLYEMDLDIRYIQCHGNTR